MSAPQQVAALDNDVVARITGEGFVTADLDNAPVTPRLQELELTLEQIELGEHEHYMAKEIAEQVLRDHIEVAIGGRRWQRCHQKRRNVALEE